MFCHQTNRGSRLLEFRHQVLIMYIYVLPINMMQFMLVLLYLTVLFEPHQDCAVSEEEIHVCVGIAKWREAVENASTVSRLHVLLGIMDASIKWEKSAENAVSWETVITYSMTPRATIKLLS